MQLQKKKEKEKNKKDRPISSLLVIYSNFNKVLTTRRELVLHSTQPREQVEFQREVCTLNPIQTVMEFIEKHKEYILFFFLSFVNYKNNWSDLHISSRILGGHSYRETLPEDHKEDLHENNNNLSVWTNEKWRWSLEEV